MTTDAESIYWYECDVLPVVGFVLASDPETALAAAKDDATDRVRAYLDSGHWKLEPVLPLTEVYANDPRDD